MTLSVADGNDSEEQLYAAACLHEANAIVQAE